MKIKIFLMSLLLTFLIACGPPPPQPAGEAEEESSAAVEEEMAEEEAEPAAEEVAEEPTAEEPAAAEPAAEEPAAEETVLDEDAEIEFTLTEAGDGAVPEDGDFVQIHIVGTLEDGTVFADSYEQGQPFPFFLNSPLMLPGINQAVEQMQVGDKATVVVPPVLGFGSQPAGPIPPNSTLYLELEFVDIADIEYEVIEEGEGEPIEIGDFVEVEYRGTLEDGTEFDNSYDRDQPFQFIVGAGQVIPGWEIGLLKMRDGGSARFIIPPDLAYGETGAGEDIPPNATLIFEVEILGVQQQEEQ